MDHPCSPYFSMIQIFVENIFMKYLHKRLPLFGGCFSFHSISPHNFLSILSLLLMDYKVCVSDPRFSLSNRIWNLIIWLLFLRVFFTTRTSSNLGSIHMIKTFVPRLVLQHIIVTNYAPQNLSTRLFVCPIYLKINITHVCSGTIFVAHD